jgi:hypothetical protein
MITGCDTSWKAMLGKDERDATEEEIAALEAEHGRFLPADGEDRALPAPRRCFLRCRHRRGAGVLRDNV